MSNEMSNETMAAEAEPQQKLDPTLPPGEQVQIMMTRLRALGPEAMPAAIEAELEAHICRMSWKAIIGLLTRLEVLRANARQEVLELREELKEVGLDLNATQIALQGAVDVLNGRARAVRGASK